MRALVAATLCASLAAAVGTATAHPGTKGRPHRVHRWVFDPGPGRDTEVSLAVDRRDPKRALVAWQEDISRIWTAVTVDGGARWRIEPLRDPAMSSVGAQDGFDPTAAIGPDGTLYVLMGVTKVPGSITLARREPDGWTYHPVDPLGTAHLWDAMHLAVAPDTGDLYATAQSVLHRTIGFWHSSDRGTTWSRLRAPQVETPAGAGRVAQDGYEYWPRLAAGPGGRVMLLTKAVVHAGEQVRATVSADAGRTFAAPMVLTEDMLAGLLLGIPGAYDGATAVAAYVTDAEIVVVRSDGGAPPWPSTRFERDDVEFAPDWSSVAASGPTTWLLHTEHDPGEAWRVLLTRIRGRTRSTVTLSSADLARPGGERAGDEYGGVAVARDGCVWAVWSEPRSSGRPVIAATRRC